MERKELNKMAMDYLNKLVKIDCERVRLQWEVEEERRIDNKNHLKLEIERQYWLYQTYDEAARELSDERERSFMYQQSEDKERVYNALVNLYKTLYNEEP